MEKQFSVTDNLEMSQDASVAPYSDIVSLSDISQWGEPELTSWLESCEVGDSINVADNKLTITRIADAAKTPACVV